MDNFPTDYYRETTENGEKLRWKVFVSQKNGDVDFVFVEELDELQDLIEQGPSWTELREITITYNR